MKKLISFLLTIFICFNCIFTTYSFAYDIKDIEKQEIVTNKEDNNKQGIIADYNKLYGISPLEKNILSKETKTNNKQLKNLAVFIKFNDNKNTNHLDDTTCVENAKKIFNSDDLFDMNSINGIIKVPSFKKYYEMQSYGKLSITTEIFPKVNGKIETYEDPHPIGYYLKYNEKNTIGYKDSTESLKRETELINNTIKHISKQIEQAGITANEIDVENDGIVDAISFFIEGQKDLPNSILWGDLLWSHKLSNDGIQETILGKRVKPYNIIYVEDYTEVAGIFSLNKGTYGTIIHEFGHTLGYKDLYRYNLQENKPVGFFDIMGNYAGSNPPNFLTYFTSEYMAETNWHKPLETISKTTNNITLFKPEFKDDNEKRAIKIQPHAGSSEYFIIEYHEKQNTYETYSADMSGIIVYRVNDKNKDVGNSTSSSNNNGEKDHIFIFRPNEQVLGEGKGELQKATLNSTRPTLGKEIELSTNTSFDNKTIYYADGSNSGIVIEVTSQTDKSVTFNVTLPKIQGEGTKTNPYLIYDVKTFLYLTKEETKNKYYKLMSDLDFANVNNYPKINFKGTLDGNNKTLKNISTIGTGVFYSIGDYNLTSMVENLNIENINITPGNGDYLGGLVSVAENATLKNIHLKSGSVKNITGFNTSSSTGGFAGNVNNTTIIDNCSTSLDVSSEKNVGGFIGINMNATIKNSYVNGKISGKSNVGAFIGLQAISDTKYNVPENTYYDYSKTKLSNAVGGYDKWMHNLNTLSEKDFGKGIVGISVLEEININKVGKISYTVTTNPSTSLKFSIISSDSNIVKYENNNIQGLKNGMAKIYVDLKVGTQVMRLESKVNVTNINVPGIDITNVIINKSEISLNEKENIQLSVTLNPTNHTLSKEIKWTSSNSKIASVDNNGKVTANLVGTATITATAINGKSANCVVTVKKKSLTILEEEVLNHFGLIKKDGYVIGFKLGSNVNNIKQNLSSYPNVKLISFKDASGNEISNGTISTNMKFTLEFNQRQYNYTVVIKGDVNGDGLIYATDYVKIKNHIMGKTRLQGAYLKAADINNDNNIYATDYVRIKNYIMGKGTIEQK